MWDNRNVFDYMDYSGERRLYADPLFIRRSLLKITGGRLDDLLEKQRSGMVLEREVAEEALTGAIRQSFELEPIDKFTGQGTSEAYCLELLKRFVEWYDAKKSNAVS